MNRVAIVDGNTLALMGLKHLLQTVVPQAEVCAFGSFAELEAADTDDFAHYFVAMDLVLAHRAFFLERRRRTIVLTMVLNDTALPGEFHSLCINQPEPLLVRALLQLQQQGHPGGRHLPQSTSGRPLLSTREIEVMALVAQGLINKEIARRLHIGLPTVVTHRRNIMEKLGVKSVSALTIYAVTHGYVDISKI